MELAVGIFTGLVGSAALWNILARVFLQKDAQHFTQQLNEAKNDFKTSLECQKADIQHTLNMAQQLHEVRLEGFRTLLGRYSDSQFDLYRELWEALCDLKVASDELWHAPSPGKVDFLADQLTSAKRWLEKSALLIEDEHYQKLSETLEGLSEYLYGKDRLVQLRKEQDMGNPEVIERRRDLVRSNSEAIDKFSLALKELRGYFQAHIRGETNEANTSNKSLNPTA